MGDYSSRLASSPSSSSSTLASKKHAPTHASKDDLSMGRKKDKNKVKANPYATIKMWRPINMTSSVSHDEDVYRNFTNFDVFMDEAKLPATGDLRNEDYFSGGHLESKTSTTTNYASSAGNGFVSNSANSSFRDHSPLGRSVSSQSNQSSRFESIDHNGHHNHHSEDASGRLKAGSLSPFIGDSSGRTAPSGVVTEPLIPRVVSVDRDDSSIIRAPPRRSRATSRPSSSMTPPPDMNGDADIPTDYPPNSSPSLNSLRARSLSADSGERGDSNERRGMTVSESSYTVVSADAASSVKGVLIKTYGPEGFDAAAQDVETMLAQLKVTMETLKTAQARVSSSNSQFQTVKQELQLQTKQFVQDAKYLVTAVTGSRETIAKHLHSAMHTLAKVLLYSQATMVRMRSVHQAQHVGFEVIKVSASFKSTVAAANAAIGKPTADPHMKYVMRQATNLAGLLSTLLKTLKNLDQN